MFGTYIKVVINESGKGVECVDGDESQHFQCEAFEVSKTGE